MKVLLYIPLLSFLSLGLVSCEKIFLEPNPKNTPESNFELMWQTLDQKYSFFTFKNINWDEVHSRYKSRIYPEMKEQELFDVLADMLHELRDGHVNLRSDFDLAHNWEWYLSSPENFDFSIIERNYLTNNYELSGPLYNTIIDSIGYIYYASFGSTIKAENIDHVISRFRGLKGVIIDIRNNTGGNTTNGNTLASRFFDQRRTVMYEFYKSGPGHDDFDYGLASSVAPDGPSQYTGKIALLANRHTFSAANQFTLYMSALPYVTIIGDTTGGGGGSPISSELANGWVYRFSSTQSFSPSGLNVEHGIPPHIQLNISQSDIANGKDPILDKALELLQ